MPSPPPDEERALDSLVARLRFRHLRLLVELQRCGTLGRAAQRLHLTQPALSKTLQEVEAAFGFTLFERGARGLTPTPQGEVVLQGAHVLLAQLGHLGEAAAASANAPETVLRLGAPPAVAAGGMLPAALGRLTYESPALTVRLQEDAVPRLFEALARGELDALLTSFNQASFAAKRPMRLVYERCGEHAYEVIAPPRHALARRRSVAWTELAREPWIMAAPELLSRQWLESEFLRAGAPLPRVRVVSNSPATHVQLVAAGVGLAAVPSALAHAERTIGRVARLAVRLTAPHVPAALVYRAASRAEPSIRRLRAAVLEPEEKRARGTARTR